MLIASLIVLYFAGTAYLQVAVGPFETKTRTGPARLYAKSALFSRERHQLVLGWLAGTKRYAGVPRTTRTVIYGMRLLLLMAAGLFALRILQILTR